MDPTAIALGLALPCLALSIMFAIVAVYLQLDCDNSKIERALADEAIKDRLTTRMLETQIRECVAQIVHTNMRLSQDRAAIVAGRRMIVEHRIIIAALNDLCRLNYRKQVVRKRIPTLSYHKPITLPYHTGVV